MLPKSRRHIFTLASRVHPGLPHLRAYRHASAQCCRNFLDTPVMGAGRQLAGKMVLVTGTGDLHALLSLALRLGADQVPGWSAAESRLAARVAGEAAAWQDLAGISESIGAGHDPLGDALCSIRGARERRSLGQTFTPLPIVASMVAGAAQAIRPGHEGPARVIDPGTGSGRFLAAAGRRWPRASLLGVEVDPAAAIIARANLAVSGLTARSHILLADYRSLRLPAAGGQTLYLGNPPYVRHHLIPAEWKRWLTATARGHDLAASTLAGLHAYFFLATAEHAVPGDCGVFITAAEWLDVNYGSLVRSLLLGVLGCQAVHLLEPTVAAFADATTTSVITSFLPGSRPGQLRLRHVGSAAGLESLDGGRQVSRELLGATSRWGPVVRGQLQGGELRLRGPGAARPHRSATGRVPAGLVELGELCRVHRGQVTGANAIWVMRRGEASLPERFLLPAVTRARELFGADVALRGTTQLRVVADLPAELDELPDTERELIWQFLATARQSGAADSYIARHRRPWWRVRLAEPAPILATYMARRPPTFVRNLAGARHLNIAHGLYPRESLPPVVLDALAGYLRGSVTLGQGRMYAGGLTKFEPGEMERLPVPVGELLALRLDPAVVPHAGEPGAVRDDLGRQDGVEVDEVQQDDKQVAAGDGRAERPP